MQPQPEEHHNHHPDSLRSVVWKVGGREFSRTAVVFACQVIVLYISIITCFVNLTVSNGPTELWITILSLSLGSLLPSPKVKRPISSSSSVVQV